VAVRSPSVRQLVMLYSEATGQKMPLSATTPYAGSLVEQGGRASAQTLPSKIRRQFHYAGECCVTGRLISLAAQVLGAYIHPTSLGRSRELSQTAK
jgi:hypothetical protein